MCISPGCVLLFQKTQVQFLVPTPDDHNPLLLQFQDIKCPLLTSVLSAMEVIRHGSGVHTYTQALIGRHKKSK